MIDWIAENSSKITWIAALVISVIVYLVKLRRKSWKLGDIEYMSVVTLMLGCSSVPIAGLLFLAAFSETVLAAFAENGIYIFIAGIALLYVAGASVTDFLRK
jgi:hypothetical protein